MSDEFDPKTFIDRLMSSEPMLNALQNMIDEIADMISDEIAPIVSSPVVALESALMFAVAAFIAVNAGKSIAQFMQTLSSVVNQVYNTNIKPLIEYTMAELAAQS